MSADLPLANRIASVELGAEYPIPSWVSQLVPLESDYFPDSAEVSKFFSWNPEGGLAVRLNNALVEMGITDPEQHAAINIALRSLAQPMIGAVRIPGPPVTIGDVRSVTGLDLIKLNGFRPSQTYVYGTEVRSLRIVEKLFGLPNIIIES